MTLHGLAVLPALPMLVVKEIPTPSPVAAAPKHCGRNLMLCRKAASILWAVGGTSDVQKENGKGTKVIYKRLVPTRQRLFKEEPQDRFVLQYLRCCGSDAFGNSSHH
mmetsp:Transcript_2042/g.4295  ORF Transcript_2042/g.4295 Transcript_2042/m.4295 type:complete len:107 (-) Transcript_2042:29-349(-)